MILTALALATVACASTSGAAGESITELRGNTALKGTEPAVLLVGPARLLHVNADRGVALYRVLRREGTTADCSAIRKEALMDWDRESELLVRKDETICVAAAGRAYPTKTPSRMRSSVSWHARPASGDLVEIQHAKN
jgi:hypothetical protein